MLTMTVPCLPTDIASSTMPSPARLVIFDCDGVLVDSEPLTMTALAALLRESGVDISSRSLLERFRGRRIADCLSELAEQHRLCLPEDFEPRLRESAARLYRQELAAVPHVRDVVQHLVEPHCVVTSAPRAKVALMLAITGLSQAFGRNIFSAYGYGIWKPDPGLFLAAAEAFAVKPQHCLVIEDSDVGVAAATAAGMAVLRFDPSADRTRAPATPRVGAVIILPDMRELPDRLSRWRRHLNADAPGRIDPALV
ncbi:HAD-IA family hydrolase [Aurantimonas sp. 22II-16-19i]|uniref:HAD family hydrolase n=1 Tax=Aurantimonas sp. 22II-16-19i TaxID=1317114 RepID=UPI00111C18CF|nr:HAD-IA family hydrolase [Aurantimonas sp. 22II-16-19i]